MKGYENLSSGPSVGNPRPMSSLDFRMMSAETASRSEASSKSIEAAVMLATRIMTVDSCIDIMRRRSPFSSIDRPMATMSRLCQELTAECMKVIEFCIADNVMAVQQGDKDESKEEDDFPTWPDVAADPPASYGDQTK